MKTVAVVGGGITGTTIARLLAESFQSSVAVTLFDQGQRGFGGRASHRRVDVASQKVLANIDDPLEDLRIIDSFDHGCQFFFASSLRFREGAIADWLAAGVVRDWEERRVLRCPGVQSTAGAAHGRDFFGISSIRGEPCYVGVDGMHSIAAFQASKAEKSGATMLSGTRVTGATRAASSGRQWEIFGQSGQAAFHNVPEAEKRAAAPPSSLGTFDAVIFTDASCSYAGWHRASAGAADVAPAMASWIASRPRIPLFACMLTVPAQSAFPDVDCVVFERLDAGGGVPPADRPTPGVKRNENRPKTPLRSHRPGRTLLPGPSHALVPLALGPLSRPAWAADFSGSQKKGVFGWFGGILGVKKGSHGDVNGYV